MYKGDQDASHTATGIPPAAQGLPKHGVERRDTVESLLTIDATISAGEPAEKSIVVRTVLKDGNKGMMRLNVSKVPNPVRL